MAEAVRQELSALAAIFCGPHEWEMLSCSETDGAVFRIHTTAEGLVGEDVPLELVFHLPAGYPLCLPGVSLSSEHLTRAQCATVKEKLLEEAGKLLSEPMIHELVLWVQQNLRCVLSQPETASRSEKHARPESAAVDDGLWIILLHVDHMRARTKYVKTVEKWAAELRLTGRLMFMGIPDPSENLQSRCGLKWKEMQREND
ncbi:RWD domain-containing protein 3 isoform X2 [Arvicola amphibius]|uniref:RWD domain-containing protein 3 isoform X2 n=1 Tax=Arvicola amphibius TaxID=1047088 RepID=UPI0018E2FB43|nr:RWD domain-containing protein 3 isoform X2 [Arvicola amphibius]